MTNHSQGSASRLQLMQIIAMALPGGAFAFGAVAAFLVSSGFERSGTSPVISLIGLGGALISFVLHLAVPRKVAPVAPASSPTLDDLYGVYLTRLIIGLGLLEGAVFLNLIAYLLEQNWWSLAVAGGLLFWMLAMFPTRTRVEQWIESQLMFTDARRES